MHRWTVTVVVMALLLAGCLGDLGAQSREPGDEDGEFAATAVEESDDDPSDAANQTGEDGGDNSTLPPDAVEVPESVNLTMTELAVVNFELPMEIVEPLVVPGARPCASPCVPVLSEMQEEPTGTLAVAQIWGIRYSGAEIDGVPVEGGVMGMVSISVEPVDHEPPVVTNSAFFHFQPLMVSAPDAVAQAFSSWGVPVPDTETSFSLEDTTPAWLAQVGLIGDGYEVDWAVAGLGWPWSTTEGTYVFLTGDAASFHGFTIWTESQGHHGVYWPIPVSGALGPLGEVHAIGTGETAFFGDGPPVTGARQVWRFSGVEDAE